MQHNKLNTSHRCTTRLETHLDYSHLKLQAIFLKTKCWTTHIFLPASNRLLFSLTLPSGFCRTVPASTFTLNGWKIQKCGRELLIGETEPPVCNVTKSTEACMSLLERVLSQSCNFPKASMQLPIRKMHHKNNWLISLQEFSSSTAG